LGDTLGRPFFGLEFAGTDGLSAPDPTIEAMADRFALAVREHRGARPVVLAGYAGGGLVALEMARRLEAEGTRVMLVALIDSTNPQLESRSFGRRVIDGLRELRAPDDMAAIRVLRNRVVAERLIQQDNLLAALRRGRLHDLVDLTPDFHRAAAVWTPPNHDGPVLIIRSHTVVPANRGWDRVVTGPLEAISVDAGHVHMMLPPHVDDVAAGLRRAIERVESTHHR
jgi:thioesterase domain-containing protein